MTARRPRAVKALAGSASGERDSGGRAIRPAPSSRSRWKAPTCPSWLPAEGKAEWKRILPELEALGLLESSDRAVIAAYCAAWARMVAAEKQINRDGVVITGYRGSRVKHPCLQIVRDQRASMIRIAQELGLTPRAREALSAAPRDDDDEDELFD